MTMTIATAAKPHVLALAPLELAAHLGVAGEPGFRARQVLEWVYGQRRLEPEAMANLPAALRQRLRADFDWDLPEIVSRLEGADGSTKLLLKTERGLIEAVILRYEERTTLCVSSQVGCKLACTFCQTGKLGFGRNLGTHEILAQYAAATRTAALKAAACPTSSTWAWESPSTTTTTSSPRPAASPPRVPKATGSRRATSRCRRRASSRASASWRRMRAWRSPSRCMRPATRCAPS